MIDTYDKLTLAVWERLAALEKRPFEDDIARQVAILAILCDKSERDILNLPLPEYSALIPKADFLFSEPTPSNIATRGLRRLKLEDTVLIPTTDFRKMTTAQYVDFQTMLQGDASIQAMLSCFLIPEGCTYCEGYDMADIHALLARSLTVRDALSLKAFFLRRLTASMRAILTSCRWAIATAPKKVRRAMRAKMEEAGMASSRSGDGSMR